MVCAFAGAAEPARLAVMGSGPSPLRDLLVVRLSESPGLALVERDLLQDALDEVSIQDLWANRTKRSRLGEVLGADFLALLNVTGNQAQLVVCDTRLGVTLQDFSLSTSDSTQEQMVATLAGLVQDIVTSYAGGITQVVAVPDFVSRDLRYDYSHLQKDFAEVLKTAFRQNPGVAIVAVSEASAIAAERDLTGEGELERPLSLFIEGEYRTTREPQSGGVSVEITLRARDSSQVLVKSTIPSVAPSEAGKELIDAFTKHLAPLTASNAAVIDEESQYRLLIERSEEFSMLGEFQRSASLREAALLLKPDASDQRIKLVREYARHNRNPYQHHAWPKGSRFDDTNPLWLAAFNQSATNWKRSLQHCEYLILNHRLSREEATDLAHNAVHSITGVRSGSSSRLVDCEAIKKDFARHVFARIAYLDPATREVRSKLTGALDIYHFVFDSALFRCDGNFLQADDLDLISDLLINRLPDSMWPSYNLNSFLKSSAVRVGRQKETTDDFTERDFLTFLDRLMKSDRPLVRVYGRYGKLCYRRTQDESSLALLEEAKAIVTEAEAVGFSLRDYDYFMGQLRSEVHSLTHELKKTVALPVPTPSPAVKPKKPIAKSRILLEPLSFRLANAEGVSEPLKPGKKWNSRGGWSGMTHFRPLDKGLDAIWSRGAVFLMHRPGELLQVLADEKLSVADVAYDGNYVWVASFYDWGISVLDRDGRELARIGEKDGLPPCGHYGLVVHPLEPGRVLVAGSFGNENRGWIAIVQFDGTQGKVEVIHEATKVWQRDDRYSMDPQRAFSPQMVFEHVIPGVKPRRLIIIQRRNGQPLMVDPESLKVSVYPGDHTNKKWFPRSDPPVEAFLSHDGIFWVAGSMDDFCSYRFNEESGLFDGVRERTRWHAGNGTTGSLARDGEWIYYAGYKWRRVNLTTGQEELLVDDYRALPNAGSGNAWRLANSTHYGLVAFFEGGLYRVQVTP